MKKNISLILILTLAALSEFFIFFFFVKPEIQNYLNRQETLAQTENKITELDQKQTELNNFIKQKDTISQIKPAIDNLLPSEAKTSDFMLELDSLAKSSNLSIPNITIQEVANKATAKTSEDGETAPKNNSSQTTSSSASEIKTLNFTSTVSGSYEDFIIFLAKLESAKRFNSLPNLSLSPSSGNVSISLNGSIYYYPKSEKSNIDFTKFDQKNIAIIKSLIEYKAFEKPSSVGSDGKDNPFADIQ